MGKSGYRDVVLRVLSVALAASFVVVGIAQPSWRLPATIEALKDVPVQVREDGREPRGALVIGGFDAGRELGDGQPGEKFQIKKGQRFLMTEIHAEGGCTIKVPQGKFMVGSCPWLDGFTDHQDDTFKVVSGNKF